MRICAFFSHSLRNAKRGGRRHFVPTWLPREDEQPAPALAAEGECTLRCASSVDVSERMNIGKGKLDDKTLRYRYSGLVVVPGAWPKRCSCCPLCEVVIRHDHLFGRMDCVACSRRDRTF